MSDVRQDPLRTRAAALAKRVDADSLAHFFDRPLVVLSAPRSGSTLLFETLVRSSGLWSIGEESHLVFQAFPELHPARRGYASGRLTERDATPALCHELRAAFRALVQDRDGRRYDDTPPDFRPTRVRLLEKTPRNALNLRFVRRVFADAKFVILVRDARETIASIAEAWRVGLRTGQFVTFPDLPGWDRRHWCLLLPHGWRAMKGKSLIEIAAFQWAAANQALIDDIKALPRERWIIVNFSELVSNPGTTVQRILEFAGIGPDPGLRALVAGALPASSTTVSVQAPGKWLQYQREIEACAPLYGSVAEQLNRLALR